MASKTDQKYLLNTKDASGQQLKYLQDIAKQAGVKDYGKMTGTQLTTAIKKKTGTSGNTYGSTIGNKTVKQYGYKVVNGKLVKDPTAFASIGSGAVAFVPGFGDTEFNPGSTEYDMALANYNNYTANQKLLEDNTNQYITTLNNGAYGANAALDNARSNAIDQISRTYDDSARNYYRLYKRQEKDLPEQLSSIGATGGASESAALNLMNNYSDNVYKNEYGRNQQISGVNDDYYNAVAQNSQQLAQQIANAYLNLGNSQLELNNSYNDSVNSILQYMQNKKDEEAKAQAESQAEAEEKKRLAALSKRNNAMRGDEAARQRQGYTTKGWTDPYTGEYNYSITGKQKTGKSSSKSGSSSKDKSSSKGKGSSNGGSTPVVKVDYNTALRNASAAMYGNSTYGMKANGASDATAYIKGLNKSGKLSDKNTSKLLKQLGLA